MADAGLKQAGRNSGDRTGELTVGRRLDLRGHPWEITARHRYIFNRDENLEEWELAAAGRRRYLEHSPCGGGGGSWSLLRKVPLEEIDPGLESFIRERQDPPAWLIWRGRTYLLQGYVAGYRREEDERRGSSNCARELVQWYFIDRRGERLIAIRQWGEREFEALVGSYISPPRPSNFSTGWMEDTGAFAAAAALHTP